MVVATSAAESDLRGSRIVQRFGTIVVVGGGCYGSYYVRQLGRAERAGAMRWNRLIVVDRDPACRVAALEPQERPSHLELAVDEWRAWFAGYLGGAAAAPGLHAIDAIVPSPLMPHLMADWLLDRARERWPLRAATAEPLGVAPAVPWQSAGADGTHYVSFAEWTCPINCIEPPRCPATKGARDWSMPPALRQYAEAERAAGRPVEGPFVFHCAHRAYGVGMLDVCDILAADTAIAERAAHSSCAFLVGTASHCHGALRRLVISL